MQPIFFTLERVKSTKNVLVNASSFKRIKNVRRLSNMPSKMVLAIPDDEVELSDFCEYFKGSVKTEISKLRHTIVTNLWQEFF